MVKTVTIPLSNASITKHALQAIMETLFECSSLQEEGKNRGRLVVHGDLGDILAYLVQNVVNENRKDLSEGVSWVEPRPDGTVVFPYVKYVP